MIISLPRYAEDFKTAFSLWKRIKSVLSATQHLMNLKMEQSSIILDLCLRKIWTGKSRDYRDVIVSEKLRFRIPLQNITVLTKTNYHISKLVRALWLVNLARPAKI